MRTMCLVSHNFSFILRSIRIGVSRFVCGMVLPLVDNADEIALRRGGNHLAAHVCGPVAQPTHGAAAASGGRPRSTRKPSQHALVGSLVGHRGTSRPLRGRRRDSIGVKAPLRLR